MDKKNIVNTSLEGELVSLENSSNLDKTNFLSEYNKEKVSEILNENKELEKYIVKTRVYFLRHYPYIEDDIYKEYNEYLKLKIDGNIDQDGINKLEELGKLIKIYDNLYDLPIDLVEIVKNIFLTDVSYFYFNKADEKDRVYITSIDLLDKFKGNDTVSVKCSGLLPSEKKKESGTVFGKLYTDFNLFYYTEVREKVKICDVKNIVIVSQRSHASPFEIIGGGEKSKSIKDSINQLELDGYLYIDYNYDGKVIKYPDNIFIVTPKNYNLILGIFRRLNIYIDGSCIEEFQNGLNKYFQNNPSLFSEYLNNPQIKNQDLHIFCLANLLKDLNTNKQIIKKFVYSLKKGDKSEEELKQIYELFQKYSNDGKFNNTVGLKLKYIGLKMHSREIDELESVLAKSDDRAIDIKNNSIDEKIRECDIEELNGNLIERKLYYYKRKSLEEIKKLEEENKGRPLEKLDYYHKIKVDLDNLLVDKVNVISANVGEGKSIELMSMKYEIDNNSEYCDFVTLFYKSSSLPSYSTLENIKTMLENDIELIQNNSEQKIVLFFDGIDEITSEYRQELKEYLIKEIVSKYKDIKIVLGSRKSEFDELGTDEYVTLSFDNLSENQVSDFLKKHLLDTEEDREKLEKIHEFLGKNIIDEELKHTPLILYFLSQLSVVDIAKIDNRARLYELITLKILSEHKLSNNVDIDDCNEMFIPLLSEIAFKIHKNQKIELNDKRLQKLSILIKKIGENQYQFVHNSFYEYFLAKYLSENENGNQEIYDKRDQSGDNWNEWRKFKPVVLLYGEILMNLESIDDLKQEGFINRLFDFLGEYSYISGDSIIQNDSIYGDGFFIGLELINKLERKYGINDDIINLKNVYLKIIKSWINNDNVIIALSKIKGFQIFQKNILYDLNDYIEMFLKIESFYSRFNNSNYVMSELKNLALEKYVLCYLEKFKSLISFREYSEAFNFIENIKSDKKDIISNKIKSFFITNLELDINFNINSYDSLLISNDELISIFNYLFENKIFDIAINIYIKLINRGLVTYTDILPIIITLVENNKIEYVKKLLHLFIIDPNYKKYICVLYYTIMRDYNVKILYEDDLYILLVGSNGELQGEEKHLSYKFDQKIKCKLEFLELKLILLKNNYDLFKIKDELNNFIKSNDALSILYECEELLINGDNNFINLVIKITDYYVDNSFYVPYLLNIYSNIVVKSDKKYIIKIIKNINKFYNIDNLDIYFKFINLFYNSNIKITPKMLSS